MRIISEKKVPIEEVRKILTEKEKREGLTEIERQTLESVCRVLNEKGVKDDVEALKVVEELKEKFNIPEDLAIQLVNCLPKTELELRTFLFERCPYIKGESYREILGVLSQLLHE